MVYGLRHDHKSAVAGGVNGAYAEDNIVFGGGNGDVDGGASGRRRNGLRVLPVEGNRVAPKEFVVVHFAGGSVPVEGCAVIQLAVVDGYLGWLAGRRRQGGERGGVEPGNLCHVAEVYKFDQVAKNGVAGTGCRMNHGLVLVVVILTPFGDAHRCEPLVVEGAMVAASQIAVGAGNDPGVEGCRAGGGKVGRADLLHGAGNLAAGRVVFAADSADLAGILRRRGRRNAL